MPNPAPGARRVGPLLAAALLAGFALVLDFALAKPGASSNLVRFVGRFHPLVVHLPIGFLLLVAFAEALTLFPRWKSRVDPVLALLWPVLAVSAVVAFGLGLLLAHDGGYPAKLVSMHRRLTLAAVIAIALNVALWQRVERGLLPRGVYRAVLLVALGLLSVGAHFGGSLSRGENYLFEFAPAFVRKLLHLQAPAAPPSAPPKAEPSAEPLVYKDVVLPIFRERCVSCHGPDKAKGGLRLDSFESLKKGGKNGAELVIADSAHSRLVQRMALPRADDEHMPPEDKPQPSPGEVDVIKWWIDRGATETLRVRDALAPEAARTLLIHSAVVSGVKGLDGALPAAPEPAPAATAAPSAGAGMPSAPQSPTATPKEPRASTSPDQKALFSSVIAPLLSNRCGKCHGAEKQKGRLRLDSNAALLQGGKNGPGVVAGDASHGTVLARLSLPPSDDQHMPPSEEPQLTASQIALLKWWVGAGASSETPAAAAPATLVASARVSRAAPRATGAVDTPAEPTDNSASASRAPADPAVLAALPATIRLYQDIVKPMLTARCGDCHGGADPDGDMRVDDYPQLLASKAIVPGKPKQSELLVRARLPPAKADHMPPASAAQPEPAELDALELWIAGGASETAVVEAASLPADVAELARRTLAGALPAASAAATSGATPAAAQKAPAKSSALASLTPTHAGCAACAIGERERPSPVVFALPLLLGLGLLQRRRTRVRAFELEWSRVRRRHGRRP